MQVFQLFRLCASTSRKRSLRRIATASLKPKHGREVAFKEKRAKTEKAEPCTAECDVRPPRQPKRS